MKIYGEYLNLKKNYVIFIISRQSSSAGIEALLESYPEFKELDRNTVQYMIDEMQEEIDGMRRELSDKNIVLDEREHTIRTQKKLLDEKKYELDRRDEEIARLKRQLEELQNTSQE